MNYLQWQEKVFDALKNFFKFLDPKMGFDLRLSDKSRQTQWI